MTDAEPHIVVVEDDVARQWLKPGIEVIPIVPRTDDGPFEATIEDVIIKAPSGAWIVALSAARKHGFTKVESASEPA